MEIRAETQKDHVRVKNLHIASFPGPGESDLVDGLRASGDAVISLVAIADGELVGHVMFSRMSAPFRALALAPIAVRPEYRRRGIGARLIDAGLSRAWKDGWEGVFVLGEPEYYSRFGFCAEAAAGFDNAYAGPYLMVVSPKGRQLPAFAGRLLHAPAFSAL